MTTRKRLRIAVWIVLIAIVGVAGVSYLHPFHTRIACGDGRLVAVSIIDGNIRLVHLSAELNMCYVQDSPLVEYADHWEHVPTSALTWNQNGQVIFRNTPIGYVAFGVSLIRPIVAFFLVVWAVKRRRLIAASMREITAPSDRQHVGLPGRVIRRSVVAILCLAALLAGGTWAVCYIGLHVNYKRRIYQNTLRLSSPHRGDYYVTFDRTRRRGPGGPFSTIRLSRGRFRVGHSSLVPVGTIVSTYDLSTTAPHKLSRRQDRGSRRRKHGSSPFEWPPNRQAAL